MSSNLLEISRTIPSGSPPIKHNGNILIKGNVEPDCMIVSDQDIEIIGDTFNSKIKSLYGNVFVRGGDQGCFFQRFCGRKRPGPVCSKRLGKGLRGYHYK